MDLNREDLEREAALTPPASNSPAYQTNTPFPMLNRAAKASNTRLPLPPPAGSIPNSDLDPETEEYRAVFNETVISLVEIPQENKLFVVRERIEALDRFIRKARIQRQALTVSIDEMYENATTEERARLLEQDKLYKAKTGVKASRTPKTSGAPKLTKAEQSMPGHWDARARKTGSVFLGMGMDLVSVEGKLKEMGLVK